MSADCGSKGPTPESAPRGTGERECVRCGALRVAGLLGPLVAGGWACYPSCPPATVPFPCSRCHDRPSCLLADACSIRRGTEAEYMREPRSAPSPSGEAPADYHVAIGGQCVDGCPHPSHRAPSGEAPRCDDERHYFEDRATWCQCGKKQWGVRPAPRSTPTAALRTAWSRLQDENARLTRENEELRDWLDTRNAHHVARGEEDYQ